MNAPDISIIGYSTRLPGSPDPAAFWSLLDEGRCAVTSVSPKRWPLARFHHPRLNTPGRSYTWAAGQIETPWDFDPGFFGISPREAIQMDPQQRLLLQVVWEALEFGSIRPGDLAGSRTGVYVGASALDYSHRFLLDPAASDVQFMTGNTLSIIANRLSYIFDLRGPSFTIDTACSSSLVALHEAAEALRAGRIDTAIVGGVNLLLSPFAFIGFSRASMLSTHGQCRAFDASGDGYVRSEGAVAVVLRTAESARRAGNREFARLAATGINADGRTVGMSLPSSVSQAELLESVYRDYELDPAALAFVEAHGTGTAVGDPAEAEALGKTLGRQRQAALPIGSVKTNIGHLEPASGLASVVKAVQALEHDRFPASLHFETPNPNIDFDELNLAVAAKPVALARRRSPRLAGINSFGFGGANAHAVIADAPRRRKPRAPGGDGPLVLSARSAAALQDLAARYGDHLATIGEDEAARVAATAAHGRDALDHRLVVLDRDRDARVVALNAFAAGAQPAGTVSGSTTATGASAGAVPIVFVYSGNGSQWAGMGCDSYKGDAAFRAAFDRFDRYFMSLSGWSLASMLFSADLASEIERTEIAQPLLLGVQVALTEALASRGIVPAAVIGHSVGEVAAAWAAGMIDRDTAARIVHARSTHQEMTRHLGGMAALLQSEEGARRAIDDSGLAELEIAAVNSPRSVTISGPGESLDDLAGYARKKRLALRRLAIDYPFHCKLIEPIRQPLLQSLDGLTSRPPACRFVSCVHPHEDAPTLDAQYWWENVRLPVRFANALATLIDENYRLFVEIGPTPLLGTYARDILRHGGHAASVLSSFDKPKPTKRDEPSPDTVLPDEIDAIAAAIYAHGGATDLAKFVAPVPSAPLALPLYPWQNKRYGPEGTVEGLQTFSGEAWPLLGFRLRSELNEWFNIIDADALSFLADHSVEGSVVFPAAGFAEMALRAAREWLGIAAVELHDFDILRPMVLEEGASLETLVRISPDDRVLEISSRPRLDDCEWTLHLRVTIAHTSGSTMAASIEGSIDGAIAHMDGDGLYELTRRFGLEYGPAFRRVAGVVVHAATHATVALAESTLDDTIFAFDPTLLDSGFHGLFALLPHAGAPDNVSFLPVRIARLCLIGTGTPVAARLCVNRVSPRSIEASFEFFDREGGLVARLTGTRFRALALMRADRPDEFVYRTTSLALPLADAPSAALTAVPDLAALSGPGDEGEAMEPEESVLLVEALARSIALSSLHAHADEHGHVNPLAAMKLGRIMPCAVPLVCALLRWLSEAGLANQALPDESATSNGDAGDPALSSSQTSGAWRLSDMDDMPDAGELLRTIALEAPERIADIALLARLATDLPRLLREGLPETAADLFAPAILEQFRTASPGFRPLYDTIADHVARIASRWPAREPLRVLLVGAQDTTLVRRLAEALDPAIGSLTVSDADDTLIARAALQWNGATHVTHLSIAEITADATWESRFDIITGVDLLTRLGRARLSDFRPLLADGAILIAAEAAPSPVLDMILGIGADWWRDTKVPENPVPRLRTARQWCAVLNDIGFTEARGTRIAHKASEAALLLARIIQPGPPSMSIAADTSSSPAAGGNASPDSARNVLILCDEQGTSHSVATALGDVLARRGRRVAIATDCGEALAAAETLATTDIVHLAGAFEHTGDDIGRVEARLGALIDLLKDLGNATTRLWIVAPDAMQDLAGARRGNPMQAAVWAFARVALNEFPDADLRLVDIAAMLEPGEFATRLADEIANPSNEREIVHGMDHRAGLRLVRGGLLDDPATPGEGLTSGDPLSRGEAMVRLDIEQQGSLDHLRWRTLERRAPSDQEVEIEVRAAGLNFRDVMWALGLLPEEALEDGFAGATLGMECAGRIVRAGAGVRGLSPGDTVIAFAPACLASHVVVAERAVARMPATLDFDEAATVPVTFLTAYYALIELAHLQEGESVLIHGGAGGVGLAALQIAKWRNATVITTAGSPEKRAFLRLLGADHVLDSRSLEFADKVMAITGGNSGGGVDVVLNSLSGEAMERSIATLKPFGRFLELGKRDFYGNTRVGLRPFRQNLSYFGIDADQLLTFQPALGKRLFAELVALFDEGVLAPLPYRVFKPGSIIDAFRVMQQSGHIGKIVLHPPAVPAPRQVAQAVRFDDAATQLVVGGFGGFGVELLRWLAAHGARHLAVIGRSGASSEAAQALVGELESRGTTVRAIACDATDREALGTALTDIRAAMPPIAGVFHTAMELNDALIANLDRAALAATLAPKIAAAQALDELTADDPVTTFVMFSSATTLVGNPGQANYVAANGYLEALARHRRARAKPALAVAWGAISDAGYLARNEEVSALLARKLGRHALTAAEALSGLERLLALPADQRASVDLAALAYAPIDWNRARCDLALVATPLISRLGLDAPSDGLDGEGAIDLAALIEGMDTTEATQTIGRLLAGEIGRILRIAPDEIVAHRPLSEIGMDSLMALELRMAAERQFGVDIPLMSLANGATLIDLSARIVKRVRGGESTIPANAETLVSQHLTQVEEEHDNPEYADLAAKVEETSHGIRKLLD